MGRIFGLKRFEIHDGDGIRTTLFLKGCPLRCRWCHNPEGLSAAPQTAWLEERCLHCGRCAAVCPAHVLEDGRHRMRFDACRGCGACADICPARALTFYGEEVSVGEVLPRLLEDRLFFDASGGGVTLSGGEPMLQADFAAAVLEALKREGIHTALDTCGFAPWTAYEKVLPWTDLVLFDVKAASEETHIACTRQSNRQILENLRRIDALGKVLDVRVPFVPGLNDHEMEAVADLLTPLRSLRHVRILPYHDYASAKYRSLGLPVPLEEVVPPDDEAVRRIVLCFRRRGLDAAGPSGDPPEDGKGTVRRS